MRIPIRVPELGCGAESLWVSGWRVDEGDAILEGDLIVEVLMRGISVDIVAEHAGRLAEIVKPVGASITVGEIVAWLDEVPR